MRLRRNASGTPNLEFGAGFAPVPKYLSNVGISDPQIHDNGVFLCCCCRFALELERRPAFASPEYGEQTRSRSRDYLIVDRMCSLPGFGSGCDLDDGHERDHYRAQILAWRVRKHSRRISA